MKKTLIALSMFSASLMSFGASAATDGQIQFTGKFITNPCEVVVDGTEISGASTTVNLEEWNTANYDEAGLTTALKPFALSLKNCPPDKDKASVRFTGTQFAANTKLFQLTNYGDTGIAGNVGVGLFASSNSSDIIEPGDNSKVSIDITGGAGETQVYAAYVTTGASSEGIANATVNVDISYE